MFGRLLGLFLMFVLAAVLFLSCGSSSTTAPATGMVFTFLGDLASCDILSFHVLITDVALTPISGPGMGTGFLPTAYPLSTSLLGGTPTPFWEPTR